MKRVRIIVILAIVAIVVVSSYQTYWLVSIYQSMDASLQKELNELVRASDFEEIVHRVDKMRDEHFGGKMEVTSKIDEGYEHTALSNTSQRTLDADAERETLLGNEVTESDFSSALSREADVMMIGLNMQRGIHSGLDQLRGPDLDDLYQIMSRRLDSLDIKVSHTLLYLRKHNDTTADTLGQVGAAIPDPVGYSIGLDLNTGTEYQLLIPRRNLIVLRRMDASLLFSLITLLMLVGAFWYAIRLIHQMRALDEMKSDFVNNITHELKTPIAVAYAANDALLNFGNNDAETTRQYLTISLQQLNQLSGLVEQILSLSMERRNNMQLQLSDVDLTEVLQSLVETHRMKSNGKAEISLDCPEGIQLRTDRMHFYNMVSNLIDNAIKYSAGKPQVSIRVRGSEGGHITLSVADKGIGIAKESLPHIFDKFYRVPTGNLHNVKGYGLGLFYVKSMLNKLGGSISVESDEGKGSRFTITL